MPSPTQVLKVAVLRHQPTKFLDPLLDEEHTKYKKKIRQTNSRMSTRKETANEEGHLKVST